MRPIIRPPQPSDGPAWHRLWIDYLDFYRATVTPEATQHTWMRILDPTGSLFGRIAERENAVIGFAICVVHEGTWSMRPTCYLEDLFVEHSARCQGVGRTLLGDLVALGTERGWDSLYWHTRADNPQARKLYDSFVQVHGFVRYGLALRSQVTN